MKREASQKSGQRWLQFSLRGFLVLLTVWCVWLGLVANRAMRQRWAVQWVEELGGEVRYAYQRTGTVPPGPAWLRDRIGIDFFSAVVEVRLTRCFDVTDVTPLAGMKHLESLHLDNTNVANLKPLTGLDRLVELHLGGTQVRDLTPLMDLKRLTWLRLDSTPVRDIGPLAHLSNLEVLHVHNSQVSDLAPLARLTKCKEVHAHNTAVSDVTPLVSLKGLKYVDLYQTRIGAEGFQILRTALPDVDIDCEWARQSH